ncbi:MAG: UDP-N-acetylmuramoyl-L-alanyl-D-glutamate--2,6-diaminopimelate ligase [Clostridiales bacterium]|nr:UDP-N-acetylmuramoyl-L-alanyl-D-glutamate--2,6-diaminopimelate ligase [Clostridiales bacterium]
MISLNELVKVVPGHVQVIGYDGNMVKSLCADSRKVESGALFFCIPGTRIDAHDYAPQAIAAGAVAVVVDRQLPIDATQVIVRDVREALSLMAAAFFGNPAKKITLIGLTGTKGKTTASFLVKSILETAGHRTSLIGTVCSMIGDEEVPASLTTPDPIDFQSLLRRMADAGVTHAVMEVSAHALALRKMEGVRFAAAAFTNLSQDHIDFFHTMDNYLAAKMLLFTPDKCKTALYNADDERVAQAMAAVPAAVPTHSVGIRASAEIYANDIEVGERGCSFRLTFNKRFRLSVQLKLSGIFNVYNAMMAAALCDAVGVKPDAIRRGLEAVRSVPGRIELLETETPFRVILDYAHSPDSLSNILTTVRQTTPRGKVIALFGCGGDRDHAKRPMMGEIGGRLADFSILTSDNPRSEDPMDILAEIEEGIKKTDGRYTVIENRREAIRWALTHAQPGDVVVLAGKGHETYQEIKGVKHPFDEKVVVRELLTEIHGKA